MISRKGYILMMLILSWPVNNIHRLLNDAPPKMVAWYPMAPNKVEDIQWYVHDVCQNISYLLIFIAIYLYTQWPKRKDPDINVVICSLLITHIVDFFHYLGWHRSNEWILTLEGLLLLIGSLKILSNYIQNGQARKI